VRRVSIDSRGLSSSFKSKLDEDASYNKVITGG